MTVSDVPDPPDAHQDILPPRDLLPLDGQPETAREYGVDLVHVVCMLGEAGARGVHVAGYPVAPAATALVVIAARMPRV